MDKMERDSDLRSELNLKITQGVRVSRVVIVEALVELDILIEN